MTTAIRKLDPLWLAFAAANLLSALANAAYGDRCWAAINGAGACSCLFASWACGDDDDAA